MLRACEGLNILFPIGTKLLCCYVSKAIKTVFSGDPQVASSVFKLAFSLLFFENSGLAFGNRSYFYFLFIIFKSLELKGLKSYKIQLICVVQLTPKLITSAL